MELNLQVCSIVLRIQCLNLFSFTIHCAASAPVERHNYHSAAPFCVGFCMLNALNLLLSHFLSLSSFLLDVSNLINSVG